MKKIFSLFLSLILICSIVLGCFSSAVFAADEEISLVKEKLNMMGNSLALTSNVFWNFGTAAVNTEMFPGEKVIVTEKAASGDTRLQIYEAVMGKPSGGKLTVSYWVYVAAKSDGTLAFRPRPNGQNNDHLHVNLNSSDFNLTPYEWYNIVAEINLNSTENNYIVKAVDSDGTPRGTHTQSYNFGTNGYVGLILLYVDPKDSGMPDADNEADKKDQTAPFYAVKDVYVTHQDGAKKANILSVGSDGKVEASDDKKISFKLSKEVSGLSSGAILVREKEDRTREIKVSSIDSVHSDGEGWVVGATLKTKLADWTEYELEISGGVYKGYKEVKADGSLASVTAFAKDFYTPAGDFDMKMKEPGFSFVGGSDLKAEAKIVSKLEPRDICLVLATYSADGKPKAIETKVYSSWEADDPGSDADISTPVAFGDMARFFAIDAITKKPLFGKSWNLNYDFVASSGENAEPGTVKLGYFDYTQKKIKVDIKHTAGYTNGILTVYSDASNPVFMDFVTTNSEGSYMREIFFPESLANDTAYTVEFIPEDTSAFSDGFKYRTTSEIEGIIRDRILAAVRQTPNSGVLKQAILGIDENDKKVYDEEFKVNRFDFVFKDDAAAQEDGGYYAQVTDKTKVFELMWPDISESTTYAELKALFNSAAKTRYEAEQTPSADSATNNDSYGSTDTVLTENKGSSSFGSSGGGGGGSAGAPAVPTVPQTAFNDISGHWAARYSRELSKRGIINGYADGSFRPENHITRAELAKVLTAAFGSAEGAAAAFSDVTADSWYYPYIANALAQGIVTGYEDGSFRPDAFVTKQDAVLMMYRAMLLKKSLPAGYAVFKDDLSISSYAIDATRCLGELGIITGNEAKEFMPQTNITRAEIAAVVCRGLDYLQSH